MKKTYFSPAIDVVTIQTTALMTGSLTMTKNSDVTINDEGAVLGRGDDGDWEDDEEF